MIKRHTPIESSETLEFKSGLLTDLLNIWREKLRGRKMPSRADLDPLEFSAAAWPHLMLIDVEKAANLRFRYRLIGSHIVNTLGRDSTGRYIDEVQDPAAYDEFVDGYRWAVENGRPLRRSGRAIFVNKEWVTFETLVLPLSLDDMAVNMLLAPAVFTTTAEPDEGLPDRGPE